MSSSSSSYYYDDYWKNYNYDDDYYNDTDKTMAGDLSLYRFFYFFLFAYATYTCLNACIRGRRSADDELEEQRNNNEQNNNEPRRTPAEEQATRRDKVKSGLEFRKILASSSPGKAAELGPPIEDDLELGLGNAMDNIDPSSLELLSEMGFTINASQKALRAVGGSDTEAAMDWIFDHKNDPDLDADPPDASNTNTEDPEISASDANRLDSSVRSLVTSSMHFLTKVGLAGRNDSQNEECCSICLEQYQVGDTVARLKRTPEQVERKKKGLQEDDHNHDGECNHWFHDHCITEWLQNHDECPLCRVGMVH